MRNGEVYKREVHHRSKTQIEKENKFLKINENLFDISHSNAIEIMSIQEDIDFLTLQQQEGRPQALRHTVDDLVINRT